MRMGVRGIMSLPIPPSLRRLGARGPALVLTVALLAAACGSDAATIELSDGRIESPGRTESQDTPFGATPVDFRYDTLDGGSAALSELGDKPVVLNFFASWCPSCIAEMPDFEAVHQAHADDVDFLGLALNDRPESAQALVTSTGVTYATGTDDGRVYELFRGIGMPTTVFIDADGIVRQVHSGVLTEETLTERIDELLLDT